MIRNGLWVGSLLASVVFGVSVAAGQAAVGAAVPTTRPAVLPSDADGLLGVAQEHARWGAARHEDRLAVADRVSSALLEDPATIHSVGLGRWQGLVRALGGDLTAEAKSAWAAKLQGAFAPDEASLFALSATQVRDLAGTLEKLGQAQRAADSAWKWLKQNQGAKGLSDSALAGVAVVGLNSGLDSSTAKVALLSALDAKWAADNAARPLGVTECGMIGQMWRLAAKPAKAREWVMRGHENGLGSEDVRAKADSDTLKLVGEMLLEYGLTGRGKGYPAFAAVLTRLAHHGALANSWIPFYSEPLGTAETRQTVRTELVDGQGNPRVIVAKILAWAYKTAGDDEFNKWLAQLDAQLAGAGADGDRKALWLLARGYADQFVPKLRNRLRSKQWLDRALAAAETEPVRLAVIGELVEYLRETNAKVAGVDILESVKGQFKTEALITVITLQQCLRAEIAAAEADGARVQAADDAARTTARLRSLQQWLAQAQAAGDAQQAAEMQAQITRLLGN